MASLVICMQLRILYNEVQRRIKKHRNYRRVVIDMESRFSPATAEELAANDDDCAICWDRMPSARKLPCGHLFHNSCLRSWLEHDTSCPTCRKSLNAFPGSSPAESEYETERPAPRVPPTLPHMPSRVGVRPVGQPNAVRGRRMNRRNHFFHFDGSQIASWLPSFSVQVTHTQFLGPRMRPVVNSQFDNMVHQLHSMFPQVPLNVIQNDLRVTRSVELTVENILEGRVEVPPVPNDEFMAGSAPSTPPSSEETFTEQVPEADDPYNIPLFTEDNQQSTSSASASPSSSSIDNEDTSDTDSSELEGAVGGTKIHGVEAFGSGYSKSPTKRELEGAVGSTDIQGVEAVGSRYSKSPTERESVLAERKEILCQQARQRFITRQKREPDKQNLGRNSTNFAESSSNSDVTEMHRPEDTQVDLSIDDRERKRALALEAAQRRLRSQSPVHPHED